MRRLLFLVALGLLGTALYRRLRTPGTGRPAHLHGTPDHWPDVVRKPAPGEAPAA